MSQDILAAIAALDAKLTGQLTALRNEVMARLDDMEVILAALEEIDDTLTALTEPPPGPATQAAATTFDAASDRYREWLRRQYGETWQEHWRDYADDTPDAPDSIGRALYRVMSKASDALLDAVEEDED